jgi:site-specific DNA-methyltransferase (adenine-specific)
MKSIVHHADCMDIMAQYPDKHFDLAVVDPPYGIGISVSMGRRAGDKKSDFHKFAGEDKETPTAEYFDELFRISKNQIIWGGNYFSLPPMPKWIVWDKQHPDGIDQAMFELAWSSHTNIQSKIFRRSPAADNNCVSNGDKRLMKVRARIHPTQKPIKLYDWIYKNYLPEGGKVIDTHLGSGSNRIAADKSGNINFVGCELDKDYFDAQEKRWSNYKAQLTIQF